MNHCRAGFQPGIGLGDCLFALRWTSELWRIRLRLLLMGFVLSCLGILQGVLRAEEFSETILFQEDSDGFKLYRIPGIVVTSDGTILAYCEARKFTEADRGEIEIHLRRSTDGGQNWSTAVQVAHHGPRLPRNPHMPEKKKTKNMGGPDEQTVNNPVAIASRDGAVRLLYCVEYMRCFVIRSLDHGLTWSEPMEITAAFESVRKQCNWQVIATGPGHGIQIATGRLIAPFWMTDYERRTPKYRGAGVVYSDDGGATWEVSDMAIASGGESNLVELANGKVMMTSRNTDARNRRVMAVSPDGANQWSQPQFIDELLEPGCMAGLVSHPGKKDNKLPLLLYSAPYTTERAHQSRSKVTIYVSQDEGRKWPIRKTIHHGPSAYSDLAVLPGGEVLCFYEKGVPARYGDHGRPWAYRYLAVAKFDLDWLLSNQSPR